MALDPNRAFRDKKRGGSVLERTKMKNLIIRCDNCGWMRAIPREVWQSQNTIICEQCGMHDMWTFTGSTVK